MYQWRHNGIDIPGANNASLILSNAQPIHVGSDDVVVRGAEGMVISLPAAVNVVHALDDFTPVGNNGSVDALALQSDGRILIAGQFKSVNGAERHLIARLLANGTLDPSFIPPLVQYGSGTVYAIAVAPDRSILMAGSFTAYPQPNFLRRLHSDGTLDSTVDLRCNSTINALAIQPDGRVIMGGAFTTLGGASRSRLARLQSNGAVDIAFNASANSEVWCLAIDHQGRILVGGNFSTINMQSRNCIARLNADGTLDSSFNLGLFGGVTAIAVQADGKILIGGGFSTLAGQPRNRIARLNPNGSVDSSFNPDASGGISSFAVQADGRIVISGGFSTIANVNRTRLARLHPDGTLDNGFVPSIPASSSVQCTAIQPDGSILVAGSFSEINGVSRPRIARILNNGVPDDLLTREGDQVFWRRTGVGPEVWRVAFDFTTDGLSWTELGAGLRAQNGWQLTTDELPPNVTLRARGFVTGGRNNGSSWFVESVAEPVLPMQQPAILVDGHPIGINAGQFGFAFTGTPGRTVAIEASTNLLHWVPVTTTILTPAPARFNEPYIPSRPTRFYRLRYEQ